MKTSQALFLKFVSPRFGSLAGAVVADQCACDLANKSPCKHEVALRVYGVPFCKIHYRIANKWLAGLYFEDKVPANTQGDQDGTRSQTA